MSGLGFKVARSRSVPTGAGYMTPTGFRIQHSFDIELPSLTKLELACPESLKPQPTPSIPKLAQPKRMPTRAIKPATSCLLRAWNFHRSTAHLTAQTSASLPRSHQY